MSELREGMRVKVVKVPQNEPAYAGLVDSLGTCTTDASDGWVNVRIDGNDGDPFEFKVEELERYNVQVIVGYAEAYFDKADGRYRFTVGGRNLWPTFRKRHGKRVRITIEVLEP
jgi:hypothetical protein